MFFVLLLLGLLEFIIMAYIKNNGKCWHSVSLFNFLPFPSNHSIRYLLLKHCNIRLDLKTNPDVLSVLPSQPFLFALLHAARSRKSLSFEASLCPTSRGRIKLAVRLSNQETLPKWPFLVHNWSGHSYFFKKKFYCIILYCIKPSSVYLRGFVVAEVSCLSVQFPCLPSDTNILAVSGYFRSRVALAKSAPPISF